MRTDWGGQTFYTRRTQRAKSALVPPRGRVRHRRADLGRARRAGPGTGRPTKAKTPIPNRADAEREPVRWSAARDPVSSQCPPCSYALCAYTEEVVSSTFWLETTAVETPFPDETTPVEHRERAATPSTSSTMSTPLPQGCGAAFSAAMNTDTRLPKHFSACIRYGNTKVHFHSPDPQVPGAACDHPGAYQHWPVSSRFHLRDCEVVPQGSGDPPGSGVIGQAAGQVGTGVTVPTRPPRDRPSDTPLAILVSSRSSPSVQVRPVPKTVS